MTVAVRRRRLAWSALAVGVVGVAVGSARWSPTTEAADAVAADVGKPNVAVLPNEAIKGVAGGSAARSALPNKAKWTAGTVSDAAKPNVAVLPTGAIDVPGDASGGRGTAPNEAKLVAGGAAVTRGGGTANDHVDFSRDVRPLLSQFCFKCHGIDDKARKAKLRLDDREAALQPAKSGERAIIPGKSADSELIKRILTNDEDEVMPPASMKVKLTDAQKRTLQKWIEQGAEYAPHWAFLAPKQAPVPTTPWADRVRNPIDAFVFARLQKEGLAPSPEADKYTLCRRLYLDLIGLPPTPAEADAFVSDPAPDAFEKLVDKLMAMPQYGERWARRWLDIARYADTNGYEKDRPRTVWPYRDWVINAFNADKSYDRFTVEQLAGDMLPDAKTPQATADQKIATGFHRNTMRNEEGGIDPMEYRFYSVVDRVATTGTAWLGMTVGCAQCHTHKYDPIRHTEYYQLMAFLDNADEPEMDLPSPDAAAKKAETEAKIESLTKDLASKWPVGDVTWEVATTSNAKATAAGPGKLEATADNSWRAAGEAPAVDTYTVVVNSDLPVVDRLKLETLMDSPKIGPGRTAHGNFVLSELTVTAEKAAADKATPASANAEPGVEKVALLDAAAGGTGPKPIKVASALATFEQAGYPAMDAIDGNPETGWAISGPDKIKPQTLTVTFAQPVKLGKGARFTVKLDQQYGQKHTIARFRLSLGGERPDARPADVQRKEVVADKFASWLARETPKAVAWRVLRPTTLGSNAPTLNLLPDDSILASGDITKSDTYTLKFDKAALAGAGAGDGGAGLKGITAVRLEALPHPSLPKNGPGMVYYEGPFGDFQLSNITLTADGKPAKFAKAVASYAVNNSGADRAIDDNLQTGWNINGGQGKPHVAVFALDKPTDASDLKLDLLFEKYYACGLGHFRVSVTTDPRALADPSAQPPEVEAALLVPAAERSAAQQDVLVRRFLLTAPELAGPRKEIDKLFASIPTATTTLVMTERTADHTRVTKLHNRGEFMDPKEEVKPGVPAFLPPLPAGAKADRLAFANWLVSPENPLTARVTVNRQWQAFFGRGIVRTTEDFGFQGEQPTHPELLDWLAVELVKRGWSMKSLNTLIVTSAVYRQAAAATPELLARDPQNTLLARGPRFRAEAEIVRDSALKVSGLLSLKLGGPSVFPPQPASVTTEGAYGALTWATSTGEDRYRRSLYTFAKRTAPFAMYGTFDAPSGEACVARRDLSNTPLQALTLLNDTVFVEAAQALGKQAAELKGDDVAKAEYVFRQVLTRPPTADERDLLAAFAAKQRERFAAGEGGKEKGAEAAAFAGGKDGDAVARAAWTATARAVMNLDEAVTKN